MANIRGIQIFPHLCCMIMMMTNSGFSFPAVAEQSPSSNISSSMSGINLLHTVNISNSGSMKMLDETLRIDPLDNFKKYRGGYNITNKHYWSSTIFTGIHGYAIGVVWILCGILYGGIQLVTLFCSKTKEKAKVRKRSYHCSHRFHLWQTMLVIFFTILAIVASGLVIGGNSRFHSEAKSVVKIIMETADEATKTIYITTGVMIDMRDKLKESNSNTEAASTFLTSTSLKLNAEAADIEKQSHKNRRFIHNGLNILYVITTVAISLNLAAAIALTVSGILRSRREVYLFIIVCWFLTLLCCLFFGMYFFLDNFAGDTCTALESFQENPYNNSLSSILPCRELLSAKSVLTDVSSGIYNLVNTVNIKISESYSNIDDLVCNPFSAPPYYEYQPEDCPANTIRIGDIPKVLHMLTCSDDTNGTCENGQFISNNDYKTVEAYTSSIQDLLNIYPDMESLVECGPVKDAFSEILLQHCKPLKKYAHLVWAALVFLSVTMVLLVLLWHLSDILHVSEEQTNRNSSLV